MADGRLELDSPEYDALKAVWNVLDHDPAMKVFKRFYRGDDAEDEAEDPPPIGKLPALRLRPVPIDERWESPHQTEEDLQLLFEIWCEGWHLSDIFGLKKVVKRALLNRNNDAALFQGGAWLMGPAGAATLDVDGDRFQKLSFPLLLNITETRVL